MVSPPSASRSPCFQLIDCDDHSRNNISLNIRLTRVIPQALVSDFSNEDANPVFQAHPSDIFSLATTPTQILTGSGQASIKIFSTNNDDFPIDQSLSDAHKLGVHHLATSKDGMRAVSAGFGGEAKIWNFTEGIWKQDSEIKGDKGDKKAGEIWAIALSADGQYLAASTYDGRVGVYDLADQNKKIREYETKGSFGMAVDLVRDAAQRPLETIDIDTKE